MFAKLALMLGVALLMAAASGSSQAKTIRFSGFDWVVRGAGAGGPGPNDWDENYVWVDQAGSLHLKVAPRDGKWYCSEVSTTTRFGFGRYQFWIDGRVDRLDPNLVLGLFNYPPRDVGRGGTHEIDIEFAHWGELSFPIGNYTVWPVQRELKSSSHTFPLTLSGDASTQRFIWSANGILFQSLAGHRDDNAHELQSWRYQPSDSADRISRQPMPVHINLWCFKGRPPTDGKPVEIIVRKFSFTPEEAGPEASRPAGEGGTKAHL